MPQSLEKHGHVLVERNPDGTYNLYTVTLAQTGITESACVELRKALGGGPMMPSPVQSLPTAPAGAQSMIPGVTPAGEQLLGIINAIGGALGIKPQSQEIAPEGFEEDAMKSSKGRKAVKPRKGMILWGGNLDIHATDPRIFLILFPKRSKDVPRGFNKAQAKANVEKVFKKSSSVTANSGYSSSVTTLLKNNSKGAAEFWAFRPEGRTKSKFVAANADVGPQIGENAWPVEIGTRGVLIVFATPKNSRAQKLLTPADDLVRGYLNKAVPEENFVNRIDR